MQPFKDEQYTAIIPTAYLTAYPRTFTDLPYSKEIFEQLEILRQENGDPVVADELKVEKLAPEIEARYRLVNKLIQQLHPSQILELASGLSTRGMVMVENHDVTYVEVDLNEMAVLKKRLTSTIMKQASDLYIESGNVLRLSDLEKAVAPFDPNKPLVIIHEGLLRYMNFAEKAQIARNVHALLERFGGTWITPDVTLKKLLNTQDSHTMPGKNNMLANMTGKNFDENSFENEEEAVKFFERQGFSVEIHRFREVANELSSPQKLNLSAEEIEKINGSGRVFVMRVTQ